MVFMKTIYFSSLKYWGLALLMTVAVLLSTVESYADDAALPALFDQRERIAQPDLSGVVRLRFLTTVDFPPFNFIDSQGKLTGFHVDLIRAVCAELKIEAKCQVQAIAYDRVQEALASGQGEAVIAGVAVTPELRRTFAFSRPILQLPARFATRTDGPQTLAQLTDKPVGVIKGSAHEAMFGAFFPQMTAKPFDNRMDMLKALKDGTVNAVFSDALQLSFWLASSEADGCCRFTQGPYFSERFLGEGLSVMVKNDDALLAQAIDHALTVLSRDGRLEDIYRRYFPIGLY